MDAGWFLDIPAYGSTNFSFQMVAKSLFTYILHSHILLIFRSLPVPYSFVTNDIYCYSNRNWGAIYDASCVSHYGPGKEWMCFHAQYPSTPPLSSPFLPFPPLFSPFLPFQQIFCSLVYFCLIFVFVLFINYI